MLSQSINFRVGPLSEIPSKEALSEMDQAKREQMFAGDSMIKKDIKASQELQRSLRRGNTMRRKQEKIEEATRLAKEDLLLRRGEGSDEKPIRSEVEGKENFKLKKHLKKYQNVDENIITNKNMLCPFQLVQEGSQFRYERPNVSQSFAFFYFRDTLSYH